MYKVGESRLTHTDHQDFVKKLTKWAGNCRMLMFCSWKKWSIMKTLNDRFDKVSVKVELYTPVSPGKIALTFWLQIIMRENTVQLALVSRDSADLRLKIFRNTIPESSRRQNLSLPHADIYLRSIYIVWGMMSNLGMIYSIREDVHQLCIIICKYYTI